MSEKSERRGKVLMLDQAQAMRLMAGRILGVTIGKAFGWTPVGWGLPEYNLHFKDERGDEFTMGSGAAYALLRFLLKDQAALIEPGSTRRGCHVKEIAYFFDTSTEKYERCLSTHPWAGQIISSGKIVTKI